jgi:hypothetical protein
MTDMPQWASLLMGAALTTLGAVAGILLTAHLNSKKSQRDEMWKLKREAYSKIIEILQRAAYYSQIVGNQEKDGWQVTEKRKQEIIETFRNHIDELGLVTGVGAFIISEEAAKALSELEGEIMNFRNAEEFSDHKHWAYSKLFSEALQKVRALAKDDLKVR